MIERTVRSGVFTRPIEGPQFEGRTGWCSHGGAGRTHPAKANPKTLEVQVPKVEGRLETVTLLGHLALLASPQDEPAGATGATLQFQKNTTAVFSRDLIAGRHYGDATAPGDIYRLNGDGTSLETLSRTDIGRVDALTIDIPGGPQPDQVVFRDLGTPASFVIFDIQFSFEPAAVCPFRGERGRIALNEIGSILRLRDKRRLDAALHQLVEGIHQCGRDLDEARGLGLTFLAAVVGALLEMDATRQMHKEQLEAARELDTLQDPALIAAATVQRVRALTDTTVRRGSRTGDAVIDEALDLMARNFTQDLDVEKVAKKVNLSPSHFRHLFRETTRQPFNKYLVSMRLEKARELLLQTQIPVTEVAETVGFRSPAHFSRAFHKRFGTAPSALRQNRR
jgi:AraC-like DNA-binding protein